MKYKKIIIRWLIILSVIYLAYGFYLYLNQRNFIYYPDDQDFETCSGFSDYEKLEENGTRFYYKENSLDELIIYYHGNAGSACDRAYNKDVFEDTGHSVIFLEYAGYSNNDKKPSQELIYKDVENLEEFIKTKDFEDIIVYGQSIGSGPASYHTSLGNVDSLILVSSFSSLETVVQSKYIVYPASILLREKYDNLENLKNFDGRLLMLHGDSDSGIPARFSRDLFDQLEMKDKEYVLIEGAGHNNIWFFEDFNSKLSSFINE